MSEKTKDKMPTLRINGISDIRYEEQINFDSSIHSAAYMRACGIIREIISEAESSWNGSETNSNFDKGTGLRNREQVCNILFFTGEKGTGKTSTMLSFMEFLKDYHRIRRKNNLQEEFLLGKDSYMFTGIEYIDASTLNDKEDILGNVLSKMLSKWKNEEQGGRYLDRGIVKGNDYDYKKKRMYIQCAEIFDRLKALNSTENVMDNDSDMFIESMESLSFSWNLKNSFQKLVEIYLDIMVYPDSGRDISKENHYLVISIDDVDMNVQSGFMLLEQIRKYLMVPNVLVLMSANYEQLEKICYHHYLKEFDKLEKSDENTQYLQKISREYLEKMAPIQRQVELLSNRGWKFFAEEKLRIQYKVDKDEQKDKNREESQKDLANKLDEEGTLCEIVSRQMYKYFGIWFGPDKKCIRHLAPDTVREICSWVCQTCTLDACFEGGQCSDLSMYENNMQWFMLSEFPRLCKKYLDTADRKIIRMLDIMEPAGQIELVKGTLCNKMKQSREQSLMKLFADAKSGYEDVQDFVSLCLIYFIMKANQSMVYAGKGHDIRTNGNATLFIDYYTVGEWGLWGTWERDIMAPMAKMGMGMNKEKCKFYSISQNNFNDDNHCLQLGLKGTFNAADKKSISAYLKKNVKLLKDYQYLLLFYKLQEANEEQMSWERNNIGTLDLRQSRRGIFSLSGFVLNLLDENSLLRKFQDWLWSEFNKMDIFNKTEEKNLREKVFIQSNGDLLLPIQNVDFIVYLGTEIQKKLGDMAPLMEIDCIKQQIKKFFVVIKECLKCYDKSNDDIEYKEYKKYEERFCNYELVRMVIDDDKDFMTLLAKSIMAHAELEPENVVQKEKDWAGEEANG